MNVFTLLKLFGHTWVSKQVKSGIDHNLGATGKQTLGANLTAAGTALQKGDSQTAADAITDVLFAIH